MSTVQSLAAPITKHNVRLRRATRHESPRPIGVRARHDPSGRVSLTIGAEMRYLSLVRHITEEVAERVCLGPEWAYDLRLAVGEACANAIEHGSPAGPQDEVTISFSWNPEELRVEVQDHGPGCWPEQKCTPSGRRDRGFGIYLMRSLMDRVDFVCDDVGTRVILTRNLRH